MGGFNAMPSLFIPGKYPVPIAWEAGRARISNYVKFVYKPLIAYT
jgi:hypothetical protein